MEHCPKCNAPIKPRQTICGRCHQPLPAAAGAPQQKNKQAAAKALQQSLLANTGQGAASPAQPPAGQKKGNRKRFAIALVLAGVLLVAGIAAALSLLPGRQAASGTPAGNELVLRGISFPAADAEESLPQLAAAAIPQNYAVGYSTPAGDAGLVTAEGFHLPAAAGQTLAQYEQAPATGALYYIVSNNERNRQLYYLAPGAAEPQLLTASAQAFYTVLADDAVFYLDYQNDTLFRYSTGGAEPAPVAQEVSGCAPSPNGTTLLCQTPAGLVLVKGQGGEATPLLEDPYATPVHISDDGNLWLYRTETPGESRLHFMWQQQEAAVLHCEKEDAVTFYAGNTGDDLLVQYPGGLLRYSSRGIETIVQTARQAEIEVVLPTQLQRRFPGPGVRGGCYATSGFSTFYYTTPGAQVASSGGGSGAAAAANALFCRRPGGEIEQLVQGPIHGSEVLLRGADAGQLYYNSGGRLWHAVRDAGGSFSHQQLAADVYDFQLSPDGSRLYYRSQNWQAEQSPLFVLQPGKQQAATQLSASASSYWLGGPDGSQCLYLEGSASAKGQTGTARLYTQGGQSEEVAGDVYAILPPTAAGHFVYVQNFTPGPQNGDAQYFGDVLLYTPNAQPLPLQTEALCHSVFSPYANSWYSQLPF